MLPAEAIAAILLLASLSGVHAQDEQAKFQWGFTQLVSTSIPSCNTLAVFVEALTGGNNTGVPPYYMMAFPVNGRPITSLIGTNASNLSWQVQYPSGTQLGLGVLDSEGSTGGISISLYTVIAGDAQCIPQTANLADFHITANVTDKLTTCQPWGLTIEGGAQPYNITIAVLNTTTVTNRTLGPTDSVLTYINRAPPGHQMIASVSDVTGRWATGSPLVHTTGSSDTNCTGLNTVSSNITSSTAQGDSSSSTHLSRSAKLGTIIGSAFAALLLLCALALGAMWWRRRTAGRRQRMPPDMHLHIAPFETSAAEHSWQMAAAQSASSAPLDHKHGGSGSVAQTPTASLLPGSSASSDPRWPSSPSHSYNDSTGASTSAALSSSSTPREHKPSGSVASSAALLPGSSSRGSTGAQTPTPASTSPLAVQRELPPPPPYVSPEFDPYQLTP
ncbi:hypothetical protein DFH06DRAFT_1168683 [Mycena polygramma]|nr:hypothetical protein DFH06DRAFT_1168683 [Mycena polygramma]